MRTSICFFSVFACLFLALLLLGTGCGNGGGGGGGGGNGSGTSGTPLTTQQRDAAINDVWNKYQSLPHHNPSDDAQTMVAYIKTKPAFSAVGVASDFTIWAQFTDGLIYALVNNDPAETRAATLPAPALPPVASSRDIALPTGSEARLLDGFFGGRPNIDATVGAFINRAGGYTVMTGRVTVDNLKAVQSNTGLLFTNLHGLRSRGQGDNAAMHCYLVTESPAASGYDQPSSPFYQDWKAGNMIAVGAENAKVWAIGPGFVQRYMHFGPNSIWINNACSGFDMEFMQAAFHQGLSAYVGWDDPVNFNDANTAAEFMIDRLAGANLDNVHPEDPPQRPFVLGSILADMATTKGTSLITNPFLDHSIWFDVEEKRITDAHLKVAYAPTTTSSPDQFAILAPSIDVMDVTQASDGTQQVTIVGSFGTKQGTVTIAGTTVSIIKWTSSQITCQLPAIGSPGEAGDVQVTVDGHKSNVVQLTEWPIVFHQVDTITYSGTAQTDSFGSTDTFSGTQTITSDLKLWLRADIHQARSQSGEKPPFNDGILREMTLASTLRPFFDGQFTGWNGSGTETVKHHVVDSMGHATDSTEYIYYVGPAGTPPVKLDGKDTRSLHHLLNANFLPKDNTITTYFEFNLSGMIATTHTITQSSGNPQVYNDTEGGIQVAPSFNSATGPGADLTMNVDSSGAIVGGSVSNTIKLSSTATDNQKLTWTTTAPAPGTAPDPNAARSAHPVVSSRRR